MAYNYEESCHPWIFYDRKILNEIKELGYISDNISKIVDGAKFSFDVPNMIISGNNLMFFDSAVFKICKKRRYFSLFNSCATFLLKVTRKLHSYKSKYSKYYEGLSVGK